MSHIDSTRNRAWVYDVGQFNPMLQGQEKVQENLDLKKVQALFNYRAGLQLVLYFRLDIVYCSYMYSIEWCT
jgi:ribosomal protein S16